MTLLLDTHVLLWWLENHKSLTSAARAAIQDGTNTVYVSAATAWEISIKRALGKLRAPDDLEEALAANRFLPLPIHFPHARLAGRLPRHHEDPFDRMLVAQARQESLTLVTHDVQLAVYEVPILWK
ncbi:MAG: type II toxin-antitoxin system VapC family toxin [Nitrospirales bacterium]|nr:type II toxin-antitoxin system VapC family toxin [Nitrospirales bacterium]